MKYVCDVCGWEYDEEKGYPEGGIAPVAVSWTMMRGCSARAPRYWPIAADSTLATLSASGR